MKVIRNLFKVALLSAGLAIIGSSTTGFAAVANVAVGISGDAFSPAVTNIALGDTVIWTWSSTFVPHSVTSTNSTPAFGSPTPSTAPHSFTNVFSTAGTFHYFCTVHLTFGMTGAVVVASASLPPTVSITNPVPGAVFAAPANVTIQASASANVGVLTNVQFLADASVVANVTAAPYSAVAGNLAAGGHTLFAIASDDSGNSATNQVAISVVTPVPMQVSAPQPVPPGKFRFTYTANAGLNYIVQSSSNLLSPDWATLVTNLAASGSIDFTDLNATLNDEYYRVGRLPNP